MASLGLKDEPVAPSAAGRFARAPAGDAEEEAGVSMFTLFARSPRLHQSFITLILLQVAYLWFALGLGLLALAQLGLVGASAGIHSLAVGATAGLVLGMMTRTARGHTGRLVHVCTSVTSPTAPSRTHSTILRLP